LKEPKVEVLTPSEDDVIEGEFKEIKDKECV